ncbi:hypothetical protein [Chryseobacterium sp. AG844]|uniref:hypothetical protein n=1 Tax=Chryseobacterium sp. AG844 TaxID=2183998 RepID=UPI000D71A1E1|nr:hypothetical protein [Chryseobacterium sp. AG844]PWW27211.1 hypothetical protein DEU40_107157 [Chryseobacterium sp. AG844]
MTKSELESRYEILTGILNDFNDAYYEYKYAKAKDKKIKEAKLYSWINLAERWITKDDDFYDIITEGSTGYEKNISLEGTFTIGYFSNDMFKILEKLKRYINTMQE